MCTSRGSDFWTETTGIISRSGKQEHINRKQNLSSNRCMFGKERETFSLANNEKQFSVAILIGCSERIFPSREKEREGNED